MDIDFYEHRFTRAQLIEITGVPKLTLQNWLHRNTISVTPKQKGGTGNRRLFSAFDVVKISTALHLTNLLVPPSLANQIVSDDRFEQWVGFSLSHSEDEPSKYYFAILYWNNDQLVVDFIANEDQWAFFRSLNEVVSESMKVSFIIRIQDIVLDVKFRIVNLLYKKLNEEKLSKLTDQERAIIAMWERSVREPGK